MSEGTKRSKRFIHITSSKQRRKQKKIQKEILRGKKKVLNLSKKTLLDAEYRLLGKGLKYCPKPKSHNKIRLKQDVLNFQEKLRPREYFAAKAFDENDDEPDMNMSNATLILNQPLFPLLVEIQFWTFILIQ